MMITTDTPAVLTADYLYHQCIMRATFAQVEQASVWYHDAQAVARDVADIMGRTLEIGASIVAAFSPRERWASNVAKAYTFAAGKPVNGLTNNLNMAKAALDFGFDALKGQKTNAFARAIAGDANAVVIDTWMIKAAGMDSNKGVNKSEYNMLADTVKRIANEHGLTPRTAQALIWIVQRGSAS